MGLMCLLGNVQLARERKKINVWHIRDVRKTGQVRKIIFKGKDCSVSEKKVRILTTLFFQQP